ncbi:MDR family MFS transporter [Deinococcus enclensis]|uniref:EmrB/QacA subfamily drug resistance transporter n=1 Tax=Deinococcus enclensis TaxID=1049582 RepID=A0ABT9MDB7_9DEIO|nr:MDR family MFS transporter [Deinococcus enclensis]MDP9764511.1 EmrB/QacA subfamily drug resistance transporter [Deinococcus enclensis]
MTATPPTPASFTAPEKKITLIGLMVVFLLAALSQNIVGTAMPRIVEELNGFSLYAWVTTSYLLASTVMVPIYGKLSDLYGRKPILVFGVIVFLIGSALCGLAGEPWLGNFLGGGMNQLIAARAVAGFGAAALITIAFTILGDMFEPAERARFGGLFGAMFGLSTVIGPVIGGFLTDNLSWRWTFYANLPLGLLALFMIIAKMPSLSHRQGGKVDVLGTLFILTTTIPLLLALTWGGVTYPWTGGVILGLLAASLASLVAFLVVESRTKDAIIPLNLFRVPIYSVGNLAGFILNIAFFGVIMFLPLYMQLVLGVSPTKSGTSMLPLMGGLILTSIVAGNVVARTGKYKPWMLAGGVILIFGLWSLTGITAHTTLPDLYWRMFLVGLGLGPTQSLFTIAIQSGVPQAQLATATSSSQFFRQIGGTIGAAVFGTLLMNNLATEMPRHLPQVPGAQMNAKSIDMKALRTAGTGSDTTGQKIQAALDEQYAQIEQALNGDAAAQAAIRANAQLPAELKALATGGLKAQVHRTLTAQADAVRRALSAGEAGRNTLLASAETPDALKTRLRAIPAQALATPQSSAAVAGQFAQGLLAQEAAAYDQAKTRALAGLKTKFDEQATTLAAQVSSGMKEGFTASVVRMYRDAIWFAVAGLIVMLFVPVIAIRTGQKSAPAAAPVPADGPEPVTPARG